MAIATTNPATGETVKVFEEISDEELERCLQRAADRLRAATPDQLRPARRPGCAGPRPCWTATTRRWPG